MIEMVIRSSGLYTFVNKLQGPTFVLFFINLM